MDGLYWKTLLNGWFGGKPLFSETPIFIESKLYILFTLSFNMNIQNVIRQSLWSSLLSFSCSLPRFIGCFVPKKVANTCELQRRVDSAMLCPVLPRVHSVSSLVTVGCIEAPRRATGQGLHLERVPWCGPHKGVGYVRINGWSTYEVFRRNVFQQ